ncbi:MAG: 2-hydroxyacyl-CoA dehydratase subunit D, partial [Candidatus Helarchaeota archaeon]
VYENLKKYKEDGKKIIGVIPHAIVPDELILASDAIPFHFCLGGTEDQMNTGHTYVSQTTCGFQRVVLGIFEEGESISNQIYDLLDVVVSGTFCNGVQNSGMYLANYFEKEQYKLIIPHTDKSNAFNFYLKELIEFKKFLEEKTGTTITTDKLNDSIKFYNELRELYRNIDKSRFEKEPIVSLSEIQNLLYDLFLNGPNRNLDTVKNFYGFLSKRTISEKKGVRIFLTGSGILIEDKFVSILEELNCSIVGDDLWTGFEFYHALVENYLQDPLQALARKYLHKNLTGRMIPDTYRISTVLNECDKRNVEGIINNYLKFCDSYSNSADAFKSFMNKKGFPVLNLERDYSENSIGQLRTRIEAFIEIISG